MSQLGFRCVCSFGKEPIVLRAEDGTVTLEWPHGKPDQCIPISVEILEQMVADANALRSTIRVLTAEQVTS